MNDIETIKTKLIANAEAKKARSKKFHEDLQALYDNKRKDMKALRQQEADLKKELKTLKAATKPTKAAPKAVKPATGTLKKAAAKVTK